MEQDTTPTRVIFRKFQGEIIALMPELPGTNDSWTCESYQHVGQHGSASIDLPLWSTPASPAEYADLKAELESIGYKIKVAHRITWRDTAKRREALRNS